MSSVCCSCQRANPDGAKFCNECGWSLRLKPCQRCDAINDCDAAKCAHCGADFRDARLQAGVAMASRGTRIASGTQLTGISELVTAETAGFKNELEVNAPSPSAVRLDPSWREAWGTAALAQSPDSPSETSSAPQQDALVSSLPGGVLVGAAG